MKKKYSIVWQEFFEDSNIAHRFYVVGQMGYLPFFIDGENLEKLEHKQQIELNELMLLKGILVGYNDKKMPFFEEINKKTFNDLLEILYHGFNINSLEQAVLNIACKLREENGNYASYQALKTGVKLIPYSSKIRSDLILDIWDRIKANPINCDSFLNEIIDLFHEININHLNREAVEMIVYITFVAIIFKGLDNEIPTFLENYIYKYINNRKLKDKIKFLLESERNSVSIVESFL